MLAQCVCVWCGNVVVGFVRWGDNRSIGAKRGGTKEQCSQKLLELADHQNVHKL